MSLHFMARDIAGTSLAFVLFALFSVIPGYVLGALLGFFGFNSRTLFARIAISICLSIAVVPIVVYLSWRSVPSIPWIVCAGAWAALPVILVRSRPIVGPLSKPRAIVLTIIAGWVVLGTLWMIDLQIGHRLYFSFLAHDYTLRAAFTAAIDRTGVPPTNPYFYPGHGYTMRYHYFWYMLCSLVQRFGAPFITGRIAVFSGTLWSGIGLVAIVALYVHSFPSKRPQNADKQMLVAVALLSVTGLDILPTALASLFSGRLYVSTEWWNESVWSWANSVFWQPHTIAALVACATGLLVIWDASKHPERRIRLSGAVVGGAAFASGLGLSVYITFVFGIALMAWLVTLLFRGRRLAASLTCLTGLLALAMAAPYLLELLGTGSGSAQAPIVFGIRRFYFVEVFTEAFGSGKPWQVPLVNALSLPLNYFLEFGFFFVVAIKMWKKIRDQGGFADEDACAVTMLATSIIVCTFLRSNVISNNDLGWRGMLIAQFILLIWAAELWDNGLFRGQKAVFTAVGAMLALGAAATLYDVTMLRLYPLMLDDFAIPRNTWMAADQKLGERTYALRQVYERLKTELPKNSIVQHNPNVESGDLFYGLYADRQTAAETSACGVLFGGPAALCPGVITPIRELFAPTGSLDFAQVDQICRQLSIGALVVKDTDSVWKDKTSWVWKKEPLIGNAYSRAFLCGAEITKP
jgi:hypothetical protein